MESLTVLLLKIRLDKLDNSLDQITFELEVDPSNVFPVTCESVTSYNSAVIPLFAVILFPEIVQPL